MLDEQFSNNVELYNFIKRDFVAFRVLAEGKEALEFLRKIKAMGLPSFIFMEDNGNEIDRFTGYSRSPDYFLRRLKLTSSGKENLKNLEEKLRNDPDNTLLMYKIWMKHRYYNNSNEAGLYLNKILEHKDDSINQEVDSITDLDNPLNLYELALYADRDYEKLIEEFPDSRFCDSIYEKLSYNYLDELDTAKASAFYAKAIEKYPENLRILRLHTTFAVNSGSDIDNAINSCEKIFRLSANRELATVKRYTELLSTKYNGLTVENILTEQYIEDNYDDPGKLFGYAYYWADRKKNLESALNAADRAIELDESGIHLDTQAVVLMKLGRYDEAVNSVERAIGINGRLQRYTDRLEEIKAEMEKKKEK